MAQDFSKTDINNIAQCIHLNAQSAPHSLAYRFINTDGTTQELSTLELAEEVNRFALLINEYIKPNDKVILAALPGLEYVISFYACLQAGAIVIPVFPPATKTMAERFIHIVHDAKPKLVICDDEIINKLKKGLLLKQYVPKKIRSLAGINDTSETLLSVLKQNKIKLLSSSDRKKIRAAKNIIVDYSHTNQIAFLQYTSGSTGNPKGVMITHDNLFDNMNIIRNALNHRQGSHMFSWLPPYHDMGLIAGILEPMYANIPATLMSTVDFIKNPMQWLNYMSHYQCTTTGAPNFAFELCIRHSEKSDLSMLDLSCVDVIANGAEPINPDIMERFYRLFKPYGLKEGAIFPCYGLAEATVMVSAKPILTQEQIISLDINQLARNKALQTNNSQSIRLVSSGIPQMDIAIVNDKTQTRCSEGEIGEIWLRGKSIALGYYDHSEETQSAFSNQIVGEEAADYLKTGDLGFLYDGELFICGRKKDMIIIHGQNYYPQDIEQQVSLSSDAIRQGCVIAYSTVEQNIEKISIVCEIKPECPEADYPHIISLIQKNLNERFYFSAHHIFLIAKQSIPKTTSGKLQRKECARQITSGKLKVLYESNEHINAKAHSTVTTQEHWFSVLSELPEQEREEQLILMLTHEVQSILDVDASTSISANEGYFNLGFDSIKAIQFKTVIEKKLDGMIEFNDDFLFNYPTINESSAFIIATLWPSYAGTIQQQHSSPDKKLERPNTNEPIAIIGMSAVFPGASSLEEFWQNVSHKVDSISQIPLSRFDIEQYYDDGRAKGTINTRKAGLIHDIEQFDADFFSISPKEAVFLDPQQRLLLKHTWLAFEHANIAPQSLVNSDTGVFIGISTQDYNALINKHYAPKDLNPYISTGNAHSTASGRISFLLGLQGPNMAVDTACSSSLVAVDLACRNLREGRCSLAISGGVNALLAPELFISFSEAGMLSPDGQCKTFDKTANGYVRGEGCGVVILKRLTEALKDNDRILAVIKGSAVNHDGISSGLTVPNGAAQQRLLKKALSDAGADKEDIDYIECHGTGTSLGDPIEANSLNEVYGRQRQNPLYLGSVKANIGHLEAAAGIAGLIKTVLCLQHQTIPAQLHFSQLNPTIKLSENLSINTEKKRIIKDNPMYAAVSSFGFSGTNAHLILSQAPQKEQLNHDRTLPDSYLFVLSAKTQASLEQLINSYCVYLKNTQESLANICFSLAVGRTHFTHRIALEVKTIAELIQILESQDILIHKVNIHDKSYSSDKIDELKNAYLSGQNVDFNLLYSPYQHILNKAVLPNYFFMEKPYWIKLSKESPQSIDHARALHPLLGCKYPSTAEESVFVQHLDMSNLDYLHDHIVYDRILFPGAAFIETAIAALIHINPMQGVHLNQFTLENALELCKEETRAYQLVLKSNTQGYNGFIQSQQTNESAWQTHAHFNAAVLVHKPIETIDLLELKACMELVPVKQLYQQLAHVGLQYGSSFQVIKEAYRRADQALVLLKSTTPDIKEYTIHPTLLDGAFQAVSLVAKDINDSYIPTVLYNVMINQVAPAELYVHVLLNKWDEHHLIATLKIYDCKGNLIAQIEEFHAKKITSAALAQLKDTIIEPKQYIEQFQPYTLPLPKDSKFRAYWQIEAPKATRIILNKLSNIIDDSTDHMKKRHMLFVYDNNFNELITAAQKALNEQPTSITLAINNAYLLANDTWVNPKHRQTIGFWQTFAQESRIPCFLIDYTTPQSLVEPLLLIEQEQLVEPILIIREQTYVPRLNYLGSNSKLYHYDSNGTYLITGGSGGLGIQLAHHLISKGVKHIGLVSRHALNDETVQWLEQEKEQGVFINHYQVDVADKQSVLAIFKLIKTSAHPVKGIFHAAGVLKDGLLSHLTPEDFHLVMHAKSAGADNLSSIIDSEPLDFMVFFSSIASIFGSAGQANYASANAYLDGLAQELFAKGRPVLSINWGPFSTVGMAKDLVSQHEQKGIIAMECKDAFQQMDKALASGSPQIVIAHIDWSKIPAYTPYFSNLIKKSAAKPVDDSWASLLAQTPPAEQNAVLNDLLRNAIAQVLGVDDSTEIGDDMDFFELGFDSMMAISLQEKIETLSGLSITLKLTDIMQYTTIEKLSQFLLAYFKTSVRDNDEL